MLIAWASPTLIWVMSHWRPDRESFRPATPLPFVPVCVVVDVSAVSAETAPPSIALANLVVATAPSTPLTLRIFAAKSGLADRATTTLMGA